MKDVTIEVFEGTLCKMVSEIQHKDECWKVPYLEDLVKYLL